MNKKLTAALLGAVMCVGSLAACGAKAPGIYDDMNEKAKMYAQYSVELNQSVKDKYWVDEVLYGYHYYPNETPDASGDLSTAYAWPYTEMVASNWRIATLSEGGKAHISDFYKKSVEGFEYYRSMSTVYHSYCATRATQLGMAAGDTYYDDNIWISREFLNAYEIFGTESYLETSEAVAKYVWSGWSNDELGGIYWCEQKKDSRNACSNAPAVILFARMYEYTDNVEWLDRAKQVYDWTYATLRDPSDNVYWDSVDNDGNVNKNEGWKFTYNTGSMIGAAVKLYEITQDEKYIEHALASSEGAYDQWFREKDGRDYRVITSANPWFNVLLFDAWVELYPYAKEEVLPYIENYEANLVHAYGMKEDGLMPTNWDTGWRKNADGSSEIKKVNVLDMAANAENMGTLAYFYQYVKEK